MSISWYTMTLSRTGENYYELYYETENTYKNPGLAVTHIQQKQKDVFCLFYFETEESKQKFINLMKFHDKTWNKICDILNWDSSKNK